MEDTEILTGMAEIIEEITGVPAADVKPEKAFVDMGPFLTRPTHRIPSITEQTSY